MNPTIPICDCILVIVVSLMRSSKYTCATEHTYASYDILKVCVISYIYVAIPTHS